MHEVITDLKEEQGLKKMCYDLFSIVPGINNASAVQILDADTLQEEEFIDNWVFPNKPCLIKGAVKHWPAVKKWKSKVYWLSVCQNFNIKVFPHQNYNDPEL